METEKISNTVCKN